MDEVKKQKCQTKIFHNYHNYDCSNNAKVERDGKWYCGTHDPVKIAEKEEVRQAKWDKANAISDLKYERRALEHKILQNKTIEELREMAKK